MLIIDSDIDSQVLDGEGGNELRRKLMPSYKAHRRKFISQSSGFQKFSKDHSRRSQLVMDVLTNCNVPVGEPSFYFCEAFCILNSEAYTLILNFDFIKLLSIIFFNLL